MAAKAARSGNDVATDGKVGLPFLGDLGDMVAS